MVIIKCDAFIEHEHLLKLYDEILEMAENGVILLPPHCSLLNEVPADEDIVVIGVEEDENGKIE